MSGVIMICALPINGIRNEGQMVPFVALLLYLFAEYYVFHCMLLFSSILFYVHLKEKAAQKQGITFREVVVWFALFIFTTLLSLGGQRCLQMVILPLTIYEGISLFSESGGFVRKLTGARLLATGFVGTTLLAFAISLLYDRQANYAMFLQAPKEIMNRLFLTVPASLLEGFGIAGQTKVGSFASLMQFLIWAFLALAMYGIIFTLKKKNGVISRQREALILLLVSLGVTAAIICITTVEPAHNYLMVSWFCAILSVVIVLDVSAKKKSFLTDIILAAIVVFAVLNLKYTWVDAVTTQDNLKDYEEVADFLVDEKVECGYGEFWDAERISLIADGQITMGHAYTMADLKMYWWLTSTEWYPPNLPQKMRTAYVVKRERAEAFEAQFANGNVPELSFENETFVVYISDVNDMKMQ